MPIRSYCVTINYFLSLFQTKWTFGHYENVAQLHFDWFVPSCKYCKAALFYFLKNVVKNQLIENSFVCVLLLNFYNHSLHSCCCFYMISCEEFCSVVIFIWENWNNHVWNTVHQKQRIDWSLSKKGCYNHKTIDNLVRQSTEKTVLDKKNLKIYSGNTL